MCVCVRVCVCVCVCVVCVLPHVFVSPSVFPPVWFSLVSPEPVPVSVSPFLPMPCFWFCAFPDLKMYLVLAFVLLLCFFFWHFALLGFGIIGFLWNKAHLLVPYPAVLLCVSALGLHQFFVIIYFLFFFTKHDIFLFLFKTWCLHHPKCISATERHHLLVYMQLPLELCYSPTLMQEYSTWPVNTL